MHYHIQIEISDLFRGFTQASVQANTEFFMIRVIQIQFNLLLSAIIFTLNAKSLF